MYRRLALALALLPAVAHAAPVSTPVTVFAAASLTNALGDIATLWQAAGHPKPVLSFASSSTLAQQIIHGAPASLFLSADEKWMDAVAAKGLAADGTRRDLLGNSLVLVEPKATLKPVTIAPGFALGAILGDHGRLAVGEPSSVPAGIYAKQALQKLGLWDEVVDRLAPEDSVRSALLLVERGEAPAGIVYGTDVGVSKSLGIAGTFPPDSHDAIRYPIAVLKNGDNAETRSFAGFLTTQAAQDVFSHYGFIAP